MLTTAALILIVTSNLVQGEVHRVSVEGEIFPLDMAVNSVDDRYDGCTEKMENLVETEYLNKEICANIAGFGDNWKNALSEKNGSQHNLKRNHLNAINVYTGPAFKKFNEDVRTGKQNYQNKSYMWYSLHFWLTEAIKTLKKTQQGCNLTYRGVNGRFHENVLNKEIRLGSFGSSSFNRTVAQTFAKNVSCFEIITCDGAYIAKYSVHNQSEVLIPPYETFIVTNIKKDDWCKTVFVLKSSGIRSDLNCTVASVKPHIFQKCQISLANRPLHLHFLLFIVSSIALIVLE